MSNDRKKSGNKNMLHVYGYWTYLLILDILNCYIERVSMGNDVVCVYIKKKDLCKNGIFKLHFQLGEGSFDDTLWIRCF